MCLDMNESFKTKCGSMKFYRVHIELLPVVLLPVIVLVLSRYCFVPLHFVVLVAHEAF